MRGHFIIAMNEPESCFICICAESQSIPPRGTEASTMMKVGNCLSGSLGFPFLFLCMHAIYFNKQCYGRLTGSSAVVATLGEMGMGRRCNLIRESGSIRRALV